jgi:hypothetical protein
MAKKTRRTQRRETTPPKIATPAAASSISRSTEFNPDYSDTIKDLKRIGTLAGTFVTILVILSIFLR